MLCCFCLLHFNIPPSSGRDQLNRTGEMCFVIGSTIIMPSTIPLKQIFTGHTSLSENCLTLIELLHTMLKEFTHWVFFFLERIVVWPGYSQGRQSYLFPENPFNPHRLEIPKEGTLVDVSSPCSLFCLCLQCSTGMMPLHCVTTCYLPLHMNKCPISSKVSHNILK